MTKYSKQEVIDRMTAHFQLMNKRNPDVLIGGLTSSEVEFIGELSSVLTEPARVYPSSSQLGARKGRQYPKTVAA